MENKKNSKGAMRFFGITLFTQAVTALIGGSIFLGPFDESEFGETTWREKVLESSTPSSSITVAVLT